ncbi:YeeE/YedE thiosulfate transporter family protein [Falsiroseomonas sp. HW251]|uniref:YeeE/YedE thiosulfate transporter family protein n=1 Tax=Falsiroseomonas sp. HW251 TaxID=3390998 RepID=UPI003D31C510
MSLAALLLAACCAAAMGFAIQRGATCAVVAVEEVIAQRSARRLAAMAEASLWVAGGLVVAQEAGLLPAMPAGYPLGWQTLAGGVLLGLGAVLNGACTFGAVARLGRGEWAFAATPTGFFLGCLAFAPLFGAVMPAPLPQGSPVLAAPGWIALPVAGAMAWRLARTARVDARAWTPHRATVVIALAFVVMLPAVGAWAYTDALAAIAAGMASGHGVRALLLVALLAGAVAGGWSAGLLGWIRPAPGQALRCLAGGAIMAWGGMLVPGANDGLILVGMPLLFPYAWAAFATMCAAIAAAKLATRRPPAPSAAPPRRPAA